MADLCTNKLIIAMTHTYQLTGMTCATCESKVKSMLFKVSGITSVEVSKDTDSATISMDKHISLSELQNALGGTGSNYQISSMDHNESSESIKDWMATYKPILLIFGYIGLWSIFTQLVVVRFVAKRFDQVSILRVAFPIIAIAMFLYLLPNQAWWIFVITPFFSIPNGVQMANFGALLSHRSQPNERGETMGINTSFSSLGQALPPLFAGLLAVMFAPSAPILIAGFFVMGAGVLFWITEKNR